MTYRITADIQYSEGFLAGLVIPDGYAVTAPTKSTAMRFVRFVAKVIADKDFVRATGTGHKYIFVSRPTLHYVPTLRA